MPLHGSTDWRSEHVRSSLGDDAPAGARARAAGGFPAPGGGGGRGVGELPWGILRPYNPISWFHPLGIHRVLARLTPRLPDVSGRLFLTFTIDPNLFGSPSDAFEHSRDRLRRVFYQLRHGVDWEGKRIQLDTPYAVKVEFHASGWAHFHVVFLTRRFLPAELLNHLWELGRTNIRRISNKHFRYLLKYVIKGGELPEWILSRRRLRVFQPSRGFLVGIEGKPASTRRKGKKRKSWCIGERLERYRRTALLMQGKQAAQVILPEPFEDLHAINLLRAAEAGRYLGRAHYQLNDSKDLLIWTNQLH